MSTPAAMDMVIPEILPQPATGDALESLEETE